MDEVNVVLVASETLSQRNQGATIGQMVGRWRQIVAEANGAVPLSVAIAAAFGCPFEGEVDPELVARLAGEAYDGGAVEMRSPWTTRSESAYRPRSATWRSGYARPPPASRCARTSTTPGTPATPTLSPRPRPGSKRSMPALVDTAAARSPRTPPATSPPRPSPTASIAPASTPVSTRRRSAKRRPG